MIMPASGHGWRRTPAGTGTVRKMLLPIRAKVLSLVIRASDNDFRSGNKYLSILQIINSQTPSAKNKIPEYEYFLHEQQQNPIPRLLICCVKKSVIFGVPGVFRLRSCFARSRGCHFHQARYQNTRQSIGTPEPSHSNTCPVKFPARGVAGLRNRWNQGWNTKIDDWSSR
jgi:hypothetical protein